MDPQEKYLREMLGRIQQEARATTPKGALTERDATLVIIGTYLQRMVIGVQELFTLVALMDQDAK